MNRYVVHGGKLVTVSEQDTIYNGGMVINDGKIIDVGEIDNMLKKYPDIPVKDFSDYVVTPSLVDCHTHLLEFASSSLYPITKETHFLAGRALLLQTLASGITALGEQICGHPSCDFSIDDYRLAIKEIPMDISFAPTSISIGFKKLAHYTAITKSKGVQQSDLSDPDIVNAIADHSDYPGENLFINATPANFTTNAVPRAGEIMYTPDILKGIVNTYHEKGKQIGVHVAGEKGIQLALDAGVDVLHHAHGITNSQIKQAKQQRARIVTTPLGGTHLKPNTPDNIVQLVQHHIDVSIASDAYLPPHPEAEELSFTEGLLQGPDAFMKIAQPGMKALQESGYKESEILALLTANPAAILGKSDRYGKLAYGLDANFLVAEGVPGLEIVDVESIKRVYFRGKCVIDRFQ